MALPNFRLGLVVDHPRRDLMGLVLVACALVERGAEVVLVPLYQQGIDVPLLKLDGLLVNYARLNNKPLLEAYRTLGLPVFVLDTEGGVLSEDGADAPKNWARLVRDSGLAACVTRHFFWGHEVRRAFLESGAFPPEAVAVTGCPRYDLCHPEWRATLGWDRQGYVLVNTNFSAINPLFTRSTEEETRAFLSVGMAEDYARRLLQEMRSVFARYLELLQALIAENSNRQFVVRPHPFENRRVYHDRFSHLANAVIEPRGDILNVINNARCVLHLNCGSAVEANLLGRLPIQLEPINTEVLRSHTPLPGRLSYLPASVDDIGYAIRHVEDLSASFDFEGNIDRLIRPYFGPLDGRAAVRVAEAILTCLAEGSDFGPRRSLALSLTSGLHRPSGPQRLQGVLANLVGSRMVAALRQSLRPARADKRFSAARVEALLATLSACSGEEATLQVAHARHPVTGVPLESLWLRRGR